MVYDLQFHVSAIETALPGADWQRCRTDYLRNLLARVPKTAQPWVATVVRRIFDQPDTDAVKAQYTRVLDMISQQFLDAAEHLYDARDDLLAFTAPGRIGLSYRVGWCGDGD